MVNSRRIIASGILYAVGLLLLASGVLPPLARAAIASIYGLLIPAGVGLFMLIGLRRPIPASVGRVQVLLAAWLLGAMAIILVYVAVERYGSLVGISDIILAMFSVMALLGFVFLREAILPRAGDFNLLRLIVMVSTPLILFRYLADIVIYSDFPVLDLFQRVHFHAGALEFARYQILNPFVANSYIPFQQLLLGLMARGAGVDPLVAEWVLPLILAPLQVCAVFVLAARLTHTHVQLALVIGISIVLLGFSNPTNGDIASMASLLVLSLLVSDIRAVESWRATLASMLIVLITTGIAIAIFRAPFYWTLLALLGVMIFPRVVKAQDAVRLTLVAVTVLVGLAFHRSAFLFIALAACAGLVLIAVDRLRRTPNNALMMIWLTLAVLLVVIGMGSHIYMEGRAHPVDDFGLWPIFDYVLEPMTGKSMDAVALDFDLSPGVGGRVALFELGRYIPLLGLFITVFFLLRLLWKAHIAKGKGFGLADSDLESIPALLAGLVIVACILTGFPFIHRGSFLALVLLAISFAMLVFPALGVRNDSPGTLRSACPYLLAYMAMMTALVMLFSGGHSKPYIERINPLLIVATAVAFSSLLPLRLLPAARLGGIILIAILMEMTLSRAYFKHFAFFGQRPPESGALSHFGDVELDAANKLAALIPSDAALVSDPKTMALVGARSGNPPLVAFSNINTMNDISRSQLQALLFQVLTEESTEAFCRGIIKIIDSNASGQLNYARVRREYEPTSGKNALLAMNYNNALVPRLERGPSSHLKTYPARSLEGSPVYSSISNSFSNSHFAIIFTQDTLDWVQHPTSPSYFPVSSPDFENAIQELRSRLGGHSRIVGNAFFMPLECK